MKRKLLFTFIALGFCLISNAQTVVTCPSCGGNRVVATYYGYVTCTTCDGTGSVVVNNANNVSFQGNGSQSDECEYIKDVVLYTYNSNWNRYDKHSVHKLYKCKVGYNHFLYLDKEWRVGTCSYPTSQQFTYFVAGAYGIYYYFN